MRAPVLVLLVAAMCVIVPATSRAAPCAGFTDVESTSPFCSSVEWMKNRGVTEGCTPPGFNPIYCPDSPVTRLQMAAFLKRLADKQTAPIWIDANGKTIGPLFGTGAYWRSPYGLAFLRLDYSADQNRGVWARFNSDLQPVYASANCTGQPYAWKQSIGPLPVRFYWRNGEYRVFRLQQFVTPAQLPIVYNAGVGSASEWTGNESSSQCNAVQVNSTDLFVPAYDLADVTNEFAEPFRLE